MGGGREFSHSSAHINSHPTSQCAVCELIESAVHNWAEGAHDVVFLTTWGELQENDECLTCQQLVLWLKEEDEKIRQQHVGSTSTSPDSEVVIDTRHNTYIRIRCVRILLPTCRIHAENVFPGRILS
jgi:hypothetical protein